MAVYDYDIFVIGGGSGGVRAARLCGAKGLRAGLAEQYRMGGTCVIRGCVPKKIFAYAASYRQAFADSAGFGWHSGKVSFDWPHLRAAKDKEIARLEQIYTQNLQKNGVEIFHERAEFIDKHTVRLASGKKLSAKIIVIAVGGRPFIPDFPGAELCLTSNEIFDVQNLPKSIFIIGGGYIAVEFASILHALGSEVTLVYRGERILRRFDADLRRLLQEELQNRGIKILCNAEVESIAKIEKSGSSAKNRADFSVKLKDGAVYKTEQVMLALGRKANTAGLGAEKAGVKLGAGGVVSVNHLLQTAADNIYALGDVTGGVELTPVAIHEAMCFVKTAFENMPCEPDYQAIPTAVFSEPELGTVGLTEAEAAAEYDALEVYCAHFRPLRNTISAAAGKMFMKILVDGSSRIVVGAHILGGEAAEMIQLLAIAVKGKVTKDIFDATMALHPSAAEELVTLYTPSYIYRNGKRQS